MEITKISYKELLVQLLSSQMMFNFVFIINNF
jgi:hypothetical protein